MFHKADRRTTTTKTSRKAEAVAAVVGKAVGLQKGTASADYIQMYHGKAPLLAGSLDVIQKASAVILQALEAKPIGEEREGQDATAVASQSVSPLVAHGERLSARPIHLHPSLRAGHMVARTSPPAGAPNIVEDKVAHVGK